MFKRKFSQTDEKQYKAQEKNIDYQETFSPLIKYTSIPIFSSAKRETTNHVHRHYESLAEQWFGRRNIRMISQNLKNSNH